MDKIQFIGMDEIKDDLEKSTIDKITNEYYGKIQDALREFTGIVIHLKQHSKGGKKKWDIRIRVNAPSKMFEAQESDWDLARTLHKVFQNLEREIEHKMKVSEHRLKHV